MSSTRVKDLPASTGVLSSDNLIVSSDNLTYKLSISDIKKEFRSKQISSRTSAAETNYNLQTVDIGNMLNIGKLSHSTVKITSSLSNSSNIGDYIEIINTSPSFDVRVVGDSGVLIRSNGNHTDLTTQYSSGKITKFDTNQWILTGDFFTSPSGTF